MKSILTWRHDARDARDRAILKLLPVPQPTNEEYWEQSFECYGWNNWHLNWTDLCLLLELRERHHNPLSALVIYYQAPFRDASSMRCKCAQIVSESQEQACHLLIHRPESLRTFYWLGSLNGRVRHSSSARRQSWASSTDHRS